MGDGGWGCGMGDGGWWRLPPPALPLQACGQGTDSVRCDNASAAWPASAHGLRGGTRGERRRQGGRVPLPVLGVRRGDGALPGQRRPRGQATGRAGRRAELRSSTRGTATPSSAPPGSAGAATGSPTVRSTSTASAPFLDELPHEHIAVGERVMVAPRPARHRTRRRVDERGATTSRSSTTCASSSVRASRTCCRCTSDRAGARTPPRTSTRPRRGTSSRWSRSPRARRR